jgi:hypothetical protein
VEDGIPIINGIPGSVTPTATATTASTAMATGTNNSSWDTVEGRDKDNDGDGDGDVTINRMEAKQAKQAQAIDVLSSSMGRDQGGVQGSAGADHQNGGGSLVPVGSSIVGDGAPAVTATSTSTSSVPAANSTEKSNAITTIDNKVNANKDDNKGSTSATSLTSTVATTSATTSATPVVTSSLITKKNSDDYELSDDES